MRCQVRERRARQPAGGGSVVLAGAFSPPALLSTLAQVCSLGLRRGPGLGAAALLVGLCFLLGVIVSVKGKEVRVPLLAQKAPRGGLFVGSCCVGPWLAGCRESLPSPARASESQRSARCGCATTGCAGPPSHPEAAGPGQAAAARGAMPAGRARPELFLLSVRVCGAPPGGRQPPHESGATRAHPSASAAPPPLPVPNHPWACSARQPSHPHAPARSARHHQTGPRTWQLAPGVERAAAARHDHASARVREVDGTVGAAAGVGRQD